MESVEVLVLSEGGDEESLGLVYTRASFYQLDRKVDTPGKKESELKNCLHQIGLYFHWALGHCLDF